MLVERDASISTGGVRLDGTLAFPLPCTGIVLFAHGSGSSRHSPRNRSVAQVLQEASLGTVLVDLLTPDEEKDDARTGHLRFDIGLLATRLTGIVDWLGRQPDTQGLPLGLFGASTGAAAALMAAADRPEEVRAVVSRGGRPDLADPALPRVTTPTLLIVGGADTQVLELNRLARERLGGEPELVVIPNAGHLFEEPGALKQVADTARDWFTRHLAL